MMNSRSRLFSISLLMLAFAVSPSHAHTPIPTTNLKRLNMTPLSPRLQTIFTRTKTVCFGRFIIDLPASAAVIFGRMTVDTEIFNFRGEAGTLDKRISDELQLIEKNHYLNTRMDTPGSLYRHVIEGKKRGQKTVVGANDGFYYVLSYVPIGSDLILLESRGGSWTTPGLKKKIEELEEIALRLRPLKNDEIPDEPGICLEGAFINMNPDFENLSMGVRFAEFPDVHLSIELLKNRGHLFEDNALDRQLKESAEAARREGHGDWYARIKMLRRGPRKIGDWTGDEALVHKPAQKTEGEGHQFIFHAVGDKMDPLRPQAEVELFTGVDKNQLGARPPSLTDAEAVALWDKLTGSIRTRPTTPSKVADNSPPALGTTVFAGHPCPQEGWWDCGEEGGNIEVVSGRRQFFRLRDAMPQAVLFRRPTLLQRIGGDPKTFQLATPTMWTLVAYDASTLEKIATAQTGVP